MPSFEIPDGPSTVPLMSQSVKGKAFRTANVTFTVTNKTDQALSCRLKAAPQADAQADWFELQGEKERPFAAGETQKVTVNVAVPAEVKSSDFKFRLQAMNVNDPGNDYAESAVATLAIAAPTPPKPGKVWPYLLVAAVLVLIVGGVAALLLWPKTPPPPPATVSMPDVTVAPQNQSFDIAKAFLAGKGFTTVSQAPVAAATGAPPGTVIKQDPPANTAEPAAGIAALPVKLSVDPGVPLPTGLIGTPVASVGNQLSAFSVSIVQLRDVHVSTDASIGMIASFTPGAGPLAKGSALTVNVHSYCPLFRCRFIRRRWADRTTLGDAPEQVGPGPGQ